jgi:hypothetical protein
LATLEKLSLNDDKTSKDELARIFGLDEDPKWQSGSLPFYTKIRPIVWQLFNESNSSKTAKVFKYFCICLKIKNFENM